MKTLCEGCGSPEYIGAHQHFDVSYEERFEKGRWRTYQHVGAWYTTLQTCELCGVTSTPKRVQFRNDVYGWDWTELVQKAVEPTKALLCMACWNKVRPIAKRRHELVRMKQMFNALTKEIANGRRKTEDHGGAEGVYSANDARS